MTGIDSSRRLRSSAGSLSRKVRAPLRVLRAEAMGMCFGVRDALQILDAIETPDDVTVHGELVHNERVLGMLERRGFHQVPETVRRPMPATKRVLVTAHGISQRERNRLEQAGKELIDTTCPLVAVAHQAAQRLHDEGHHVVVIGKRDHVEVRGIIEDLPDPIVVSSPEEVETWPHDKLGVISQTTTQTIKTDAIVEAIRDRNPHAEVAVRDTICSPTKQRTAALDQLIRACDTLVVVGGRHSNNTRQLVHKATSRGLPTHHVQGPNDLRMEWFRESSCVGLTAGTSTLDHTIDEVERRLLELSAAT